MWSELFFTFLLAEQDKINTRRDIVEPHILLLFCPLANHTYAPGRNVFFFCEVFNGMYLHEIDLYNWTNGF